MVEHGTAGAHAFAMSVQVRRWGWSSLVAALRDVLSELDESVVAKSAAKVPPAPGLARVWLWRSAFLAVACAALAYYSRLMWRER